MQRKRRPHPAILLLLGAVFGGLILAPALAGASILAGPTQDRASSPSAGSASRALSKTPLIRTSITGKVKVKQLCIISAQVKGKTTLNLYIAGKRVANSALGTVRYSWKPTKAGTYKIEARAPKYKTKSVRNITVVAARRTADLNAVTFTDTNDGWVVGMGGAIYATTNAGLTWSPQSSASYANLSGVAFVGSHGWTAGTDPTGRAAILATSDGGAHWQTQPLPGAADLTVMPVVFVDPSHGFVGGGNTMNSQGVLLTTANGGATWTRQEFNWDHGFAALSFIDPLHGWGVDSDLMGDRVIEATTDGGSSWSAQNVGKTSLRAISVADATHGCAVGDGGAILATSDGVHWLPRSSGTIVKLSGVDFVDAAHGWAVGAGGTILATPDGGTTWTAQASGTTRDLRAVAFADATHGWVVGALGTILATADGGAHWTAQ